jgi:hypothetical protein
MRRSSDITPATLDRLSLPYALRALAVREVPASFYLLVQLALPLAVQSWSAGLVRVTGGLVGLSAFGIWALCEQRLEREEQWRAQGFASGRWTSALLRAARFAAGLTAGLLAVCLASELFISVLSRISGRAGIAG